MQLLYNVVLVSCSTAKWTSHMYTYIHSFSGDWVTLDWMVMETLSNGWHFSWNLNDEKEPACKDLEEELCRKRKQGTNAKRLRRGEVGWLKHTGDWREGWVSSGRQKGGQKREHVKPQGLFHYHLYLSIIIHRIIYHKSTLLSLWVDAKFLKYTISYSWW